jgi:hypothetical protein
MAMALPSRAFLASLVSLGVHLGLGLGVVLSASPARFPAAPEAADAWSGSAVEVESLGPDEHSAAPTGDAPGAAAPGELAVPTPEPAAPSSEVAEPTQPAKERPSRVRAVAPPSTAPLSAREETSSEPRVKNPVEAALAAGQATFKGGASDGAESSPAREASASPSTFGAEGLPPGVRHLPKAFARALPQAGWRDSSWLELPLGHVGELEFELVVDEQGKLGELVYVDPKASARQPAPLRRMVERGLMMLRSGTFSLAPSARESGRQRLKIVAALSQVAAAPETWSFDPPQPGRAGRSVFVLTSGLRMEARISLVR